MLHGFTRYATGAGVAIVLPLAMIAPAQAGFATVRQPATPLAGPASRTPVPGTPHFKAVTKRTEQIRQLVQCGSIMYAVGTFSQILQGGKIYSRNNAFSFLAAKPFTVTSWNPDPNGTVDSVALSPGCSTAYLGGGFTAVAGAAAKHLAAVSTSAGALIGSFAHSANGTVETLALDGSHLLTGGNFTIVNGSPSGYMASLDAGTGKDDGFLSLDIHGNYRFPHVQPNATRVYNQQLSHGGSLDLVEGDFTSVAGKGRQQIFMLNLAGSHASVTGWTSPQFDGSSKHYDYQCSGIESFYIRSAAWSSDDATVYIGDTGFKPWNLSNRGARRGLCDAAAAFPATPQPVTSTWINYTGCDSLYSAVADSSTAYFAGHERWSENPDGCNNPGKGAISSPGIEGLSPSSGKLTFDPTRARGLGADDMVITGAGTGTGSGGLWIASDNAYGSQMCGKAQGLSGICLLPY